MFFYEKYFGHYDLLLIQKFLQSGFLTDPDLYLKCSPKISVLFAFWQNGVFELFAGRFWRVTCRKFDITIILLVDTNTRLF